MYDINALTMRAMLISSTGATELTVKLREKLSVMMSGGLDSIYPTVGADNSDNVGMPKILHLGVSNHDLLVLGFSKTKWNGKKLDDWSLRRRYPSIGKNHTRAMRQIRKDAVEILKPAIVNDKSFANFRQGRSDIERKLQVQPLWTDGVALRFPDFSEASQCLSCCADPQCKSLGDQEWEKAKHDGGPREFPPLACAEVETNLFILHEDH